MTDLQSFKAPTPILDTVIVDGVLTVLIDQASGEPVAVQDTLTGCAASLMYSQGSIARAQTIARQAWASTSDLF